MYKKVLPSFILKREREHMKNENRKNDFVSKFLLFLGKSKERKKEIMKEWKMNTVKNLYNNEDKDKNYFNKFCYSLLYLILYFIIH